MNLTKINNSVERAYKRLDTIYDMYNIYPKNTKGEGTQYDPDYYQYKLNSTNGTEQLPLRLPHLFLKHIFRKTD